MAHTQPLAFSPNKEDQHHGGDQHIHSKESADAIGEKLLDEESHVEAVLHDPGEELRVGKHDSENAKQQVNVFSIHLEISYLHFSRGCALVSF
jgi:hypothetical protein